LTYSDNPIEQLQLLASMSLPAARSTVGASENASWTEIQHEAVRGTALQAVLIQAEEYANSVGRSVTTLPLFIPDDAENVSIGIDLYSGLPAEREVLRGYRVIAQLLNEATKKQVSTSDGNEDQDLGELAK